MKALKRVLAMLVAVMMLVTAFAACNSSKEEDKKEETSQATTQEQSATADNADPVAKFSELKIKVLGANQTGSKTPTNDVLTKIWREKTKVIPEIVIIPPGQETMQWIQMQVVAGTMPDVLGATNGVFDNGDIYNYLIKEGILREVTLDDMNKYLPRISKRLQKLGTSVEEWYKANVDPRDNKLWNFPQGAPTEISNEYRELPWIARGIGPTPYAMWVRDDILKKIYPQAKSEAEVKQLFVSKGKLDYSDIDDIPVHTPDELYQFCLKIKDLNMKVGNKAVIPIHPMMNSDVGSLMWSMYSFPGLWWDGLIDRFYSKGATELTYFASTPEWKSYIQWMNKAYNDGLLGKEIFIQKDDQREAKIVNGEYAIFQRWNNVNGARKKSQEENRGYGFRLLYTFPQELKTKYQDASNRVFGIRGSWNAIGINAKTIKDEQIPQIYNWIDWNGSEEAAELRAWGTPDMSTGEKENRRFKPEYKQLEEYAVSSKQSEKDGIYYGLYMRENPGGTGWNHETYGIYRDWNYPSRPLEVYPRDTSNMDLGDVCDEAIKAHYREKMKFFKEKPATPEISAADAEFKKISADYDALKKVASFDADGAKVATVKAIVGKPQDFDKNYAAYEKYLTPEFMESLKKQAEIFGKYKELYDANLEPLN